MNNKCNDHFHYLCQVTDIALGKSKSFSINNKKGPKIKIAIFNVQGKYYAISNICKHVGGPLSQGLLEGNVVTCPWHGWKYSVVNGRSPHKGGDSVDSYETKIITQNDKGLAVDDISANQKGFVLVGGEYWKAKTESRKLDIKKGDSVKIINKEGHILVVRKL